MSTDTEVLRKTESIQGVCDQIRPRIFKVAKKVTGMPFSGLHHHVDVVLNVIKDVMTTKPIKSTKNILFMDVGEIWEKIKDCVAGCLSEHVSEDAVRNFKKILYTKLW